MGGWKLEVARMALYVTFPVGLFHYFNQPEYFEEWVVQKKQELYPPQNTAKKLKFDEAVRKIKQQQEMAMVAALEESESDSYDKLT